jgi:hypothetical protein
MKTYKAHGLSIESDIRFPELLECSEKSKISITYGNFDYSSKKSLGRGCF